MLYITYTCPQTNRPVEKTWHVGNPAPTTPEQAQDVLVQADGHEAQYIEQNFKNVPLAPHKRVVRWVGDVARFIALNLGD